MEIMTLVAITLVLLVFLLTMGVPLPFCFGGALMFMNLVGGESMKGLTYWGLNQITNPVILCVPLFIFAGSLMSASGIAKSLLDFVNVFVGRVKGGLGVVAAVSCAIIGAISGSGFTGVAATGPILIPRMEQEGYPRGYATALVTDSSILGLLIPPSVTMIIYGWVTETSILACFLSTVGPGILVTILFSVINLVWARKFPLVLEPEVHGAERFKLFLDRWYAKAHRDEDKAMFRGRRVIAAIPFEDTDPATARHVQGMLKDALEYVGAELYATILAPGVNGPQDILTKPEILAAAYRAGKAAVGDK